MTLDKSLLEQVKQVFASLKDNYTFRISCDPASELGKEMIGFFTDFSTTSPRIGVEVEEANSDKAVASLEKEGAQLRRPGTYSD